MSAPNPAVGDVRRVASQYEVWTGHAWLRVADAAEDARLAAILRRFIAANTNDHGYVAVLPIPRSESHPSELTLDGHVKVDDEDRALIERLMGEAP